MAKAMVVVVVAVVETQLLWVQMKPVEKNGKRESIVQPSKECEHNTSTAHTHRPDVTGQWNIPEGMTLT